jgi:tagatose 1,6-diphosphate aldolase
MGLPLGTIRGLDACASRRGTFAVLALDHRQNLRKELRPEAPASVGFDEMVAFKGAVVRALAEAATGVLLDPEVGVAHAIVEGSLPGRAGLMVAVEATGYEGEAAQRVSRVLPGWSVAKAKRLGADALKLLLYYHPEARSAAAQEGLLADVAAACREHDLALFLEPLGYSPTDGGKLLGEERRRCVVETARRLTPVGADVLKAEFPFDAGVTDRTRWEEACAELEEASRVPWVLLSGGVDEATFEAQIEVASAAGASGVLVGRSVWAPSATLPAGDRDAWLADEGLARLERIARLVDERAVPWRERSPLGALPAPGEGWYRDYAP